MTTWSWLLLHLISVSALAALVWVLCLGLKNRPAWRHALWLVVLIKLVTPPLVTWPWSTSEIAGYVRPEAEPVATVEREAEPTLLNESITTLTIPIPIRSRLTSTHSRGRNQFLTSHRLPHRRPRTR